MAAVAGLRASPAPPRLSVVVVYFNTPQVLEDCLSSLRVAAAGVDAETIVIDNGSEPVNQQRPQTRPGFRILRNKFNRGFAVAANQGASSARGEYLLFLNSDAFITRDCLQVLLSTMESNPDLAGVAPMLASADGRLESPAMQFLGPLSQTAGLFGAGRRRRPSPVRGKALIEVDWIRACVLMVRASTFRAVGAFDENYFFYEEDEDLCWRLRRRGHRVAVATTASCRHVGGASVRIAGQWPLAQLYAGQSRFVARRYGRVPALLYRVSVTLALALKVAKPGGSYTIRKLRTILSSLWERA